MLIPPIGRYMTKQPWTIESHELLSRADAVMREHRVRHLPVVDNGELVGIVSDRDLWMFQSESAQRASRVRNAMNEFVFAVTTNAPMSERKLGSAVILTDRGAVEGIFTVVDACRALAEILDRTVA